MRSVCISSILKADHCDKILILCKQGFSRFRLLHLTWQFKFEILWGYDVGLSP